MTVTCVWTHPNETYECLIDALPAGGYRASIPAMPEIDVWCEGYEGARQALAEAAHSWLRNARAAGRPIPPPNRSVTAEEAFAPIDPDRADAILAGLGQQPYCVRSGLPNGHTYPVVLNKGPGHFYMAEVPALERCTANAKSFSAVMLALEHGVHNWIVEAVRTGGPVPDLEPLPALSSLPHNQARAPHPHARVVQVWPVAGKLRILLSDGCVLVVPVDPWPKLRTAVGADLMDWEARARGLAIAWPALDEIVWLDDLMG